MGKTSKFVPRKKKKARKEKLKRNGFGKFPYHTALVSSTVVLCKSIFFYAFVCNWAFHSDISNPLHNSICSNNFMLVSLIDHGKKTRILLQRNKKLNAFSNNVSRI